MITPDAALAEGAAALAAVGIDNPRFEARLLLEAATGRPRASLLAMGAQPLPAGQAGEFRALVARRREREPMAYILGRAEFWSLSFVVGPGVLVPRGDSETLIEAAQAAFPDPTQPLRLLDIGVGSGCLLMTLLHLYPSAHGVGTDLGAAALDCARLNAQRLGVEHRVQLVQTPWADGIDGPFDLVVSNPPYIASDEIDGLQPEVARFEPRLALDGGPDGLDGYRAILAELPCLLANGGTALLELGQGQLAAVVALAATAGFAAAARHDLAGVPRCLRLTRARGG